MSKDFLRLKDIQFWVHFKEIGSTHQFLWDWRVEGRNYNHGIRIFGNGKNRGQKEIEGVRDCCRNYWANFELIGVAGFLHC